MTGVIMYVVKLCSILIFLFTSLNSLIAQTQDFESFLKSIPVIEQKYLDLFFRAFFLEDDFAFTLFGDKPMSFSGISHQKIAYKVTLPNVNQLPIWQSLKIFKKWKANLLNENFLFILNEDKDEIFIYFINRKAFIKSINENIDVFIKELGDNFTADAFIIEILEGKKTFLDLIHYHEGILGILLGYGRHNSLLFQMKADILGRCWAYEKSVQNKNDLIKKKSEFISDKETLDYLDEKLKSFSKEIDYCFLLPVGPLGFASDNDHLETKKLAIKYRSLREKINQCFSKESALEVIIKKLIFSN